MAEPVSRRQFLSAAATGVLGAVSGPIGVGRGIDAETVPRSGSIDGTLEAVERTVVEYMAERAVPGGALGIGRNGDVLAERAYGWDDPDQTAPLTTDALFRIASVTKPITRAAAHRLVRHDRLAYDDAVLPLLDIDRPADVDPRLSDVTVRHLLEHRGGWDRSESVDPMFVPRRIADELGLDRPPERREIVRYTFGLPLDFDPGERSAYSNFGYAVLGTLIEDVTGEPYGQHVRRHVLDPVGAGDIALARTLPGHRPAREVWYASDRYCLSAIDVDAYWPVRCPDGGFYIEAMDSHGGHVATGRSLLRFLDAFWLSGHPREEDASGIGQMTGALPGTFALASQPGESLDVVVLFSRLTDGATALVPRLGRALADVDASAL